MDKLLVAPSILSADFAQMGQAIKLLKDWNADWVHCDIMDGVFVPNITFGMPMVKALRPLTQLPLDVHLMIVNPDKYIPQFLDAGADIITFHADACTCVEQMLDYVHSRGKLVGLVINPNVAVDSVLPYIDKLDIIMLMGVYPGFGGQKFIPEVMDKIVQAKELIGQRNIILELDGGVTLDNVAEMASKGLNVAVGGNCVFSASNPATAIKAMQESACADKI